MTTRAARAAEEYMTELILHLNSIRRFTDLPREPSYYLGSQVADAYIEGIRFAVEEARKNKLWVNKGNCFVVMMSDLETLLTEEEK